jgi:RimJ/RimL family protein N-acetyltransferase
MVETAAVTEPQETQLRDGSTAVVRPIAPTDVAAWRNFYSRLSERSVYRRFFGQHPYPSDAEVEYFVTVDGSERMAFVVERDGAILGIGRYDLIGTLGAEVAFAVADDDQGKGVGTVLLNSLIEHAAQQGIHRFLAATLAENTAALNVFRRAGFTVESTTRAGETRVALDLPLPAPEEAHP